MGFRRNLVVPLYNNRHHHTSYVHMSMKSSKLIVGLNKYSHDASCAIIDSSNGKLLFSQAKERLTGRKHDGGGVGSTHDIQLIQLYHSGVIFIGNTLILCNNNNIIYYNPTIMFDLHSVLYLQLFIVWPIQFALAMLHGIDLF